MVSFAGGEGNLEVLVATSTALLQSFDTGGHFAPIADVLLVLTPDGALSGEAARISQRFFSQMPQPAERAAASAVGDLPVVFEGPTDRSP